MLDIIAVTLMLNLGLCGSIVDKDHVLTAEPITDETMELCNFSVAFYKPYTAPRITGEYSPYYVNIHKTYPSTFIFASCPATLWRREGSICPKDM